MRKITKWIYKFYQINHRLFNVTTFPLPPKKRCDDFELMRHAFAFIYLKYIIISTKTHDSHNLHRVRVTIQVDRNRIVI